MRTCGGTQSGYSTASVWTLFWGICIVYRGTVYPRSVSLLVLSGRARRRHTRGDGEPRENSQRSTEKERWLLLPFLLSFPFRQGWIRCLNWLYWQTWLSPTLPFPVHVLENLYKCILVRVNDMSVVPSSVLNSWLRVKRWSGNEGPMEEELGWVVGMMAVCSVVWVVQFSKYSLGACQELCWLLGIERWTNSAAAWPGSTWWGQHVVRWKPYERNPWLGEGRRPASRGRG